jgi:uncharacterized protein
MQKFSFDFFEDFHSKFKGDNAVTFPVCLECGGICEYKKISSLLPGEAEFMAHKKGMELSAFRDIYLDGFAFNGEVIDIIKCNVYCPLLSEDFSCMARGFKPLMCLIYPIIYLEENGKFTVGLDDRCPMINREDTRGFFVTEGIPMVEALKIPDEWIRIDYAFDLYDFDYNKLMAIRNMPMDKYRVFTLEEMMNCLDETK